MNTIKRHLPTASRLVLGFGFLIFGLNGFLHFLPQPPLPPAAGGFIGGLMQASYFFPLLKSIEVVAGFLLITGLLVPFALTLLAPILVNIAAFHLFLAPAGMPLVVVLLAAELHLAFTYRTAFAPLFARQPRVASSPSRSLVEPPHAAAA